MTLRPDLACKETRSVLLEEVQRLVITVKDKIIRKLPPPSKKGNQNHHKYIYQFVLLVLHTWAIDSNSKNKESCEFSKVLIRHLDFSKETKLTTSLI